MGVGGDVMLRVMDNLIEGLGLTHPHYTNIYRGKQVFTHRETKCAHRPEDATLTITLTLTH